MAQVKKFRLPPAAMIAISVLAVILIGTALLCIPAAANDGVTDFMAAFFTAVSATCVTGLSAVDTASHWSYFGQAIILVLMQIGGLGLITILSVFFLYMQKRVSLSQRKLVMQSAGSVNLEGIKKLVKYIFIVTLACELIGAVLLSISFVRVMGWGRGIWQSVFTAVSAFCNCGYTLTGWYGQDSLNAYISDPVVCLTHKTSRHFLYVGIAANGGVQHGVIFGALGRGRHSHHRPHVHRRQPRFHRGRHKDHNHSRAHNVRRLHGPPQN